MDLCLSNIADEKGEIQNFLKTRTELYNLEPIGIGTPYVESISSYISRLAIAHNVSVSYLLKDVLIPYLKKGHIIKELSFGVTKGTYLYINENSTVTMEYVNALELLTGRRDIINLTMLNWKGIFQHSIRSPHRKWCPSCLEQWKSESKCIYEPLIWYLSDIEKCELHEISLEEKCPKCDKNLPFLHSYIEVGYCQYCNSWLGNHDNISKKVISDEEKFTVLNYKQLIENSAKLNSFPSNSFIPKLLCSLIDKLGFKSVHSFSTFLGYNQTTIKEWIDQKYLPKHKTLISISKKLDNTIYDLIYKEDIAFNIDVKQYNTRKKGIPKDEIQYHLINELNSDKTKSLYKIAKENGFYIDTAKNHFPELCKQISEIYQNYKNEQAMEKHRELETKLMDCLSLDVPISFKQFLEQYDVTRDYARNHAPMLCKQVSKRYREHISKLKEERIANILSDINMAAVKLHNDGVFPSIGKLQIELGNKSIFLEKRIRNGWKTIVEDLGYKLD